MKKINFNFLVNKFDCFLFDQWGVIHDGNKKFSYVNETFLKLKNKKKKIIILSNTSQNKQEAISETFKNLKINYNNFDEIITSGEFLEYLGQSKNKKFEKIQKLFKKKNCYLISNGKKSNIIKNLNLKPVKYENSKFILATSIKPNVKIDIIQKKLIKLIKKKIEMICTNPDQYVFDGKVGNFVNQVGILAKFYERNHGIVHYIGKPYNNIFKFALRKVSLPKNKIIMIGDSLVTDILGANSTGIKSALVNDGFIKGEKKKFGSLTLDKIIKKMKIKPNFLIQNIKL